MSFELGPRRGIYLNVHDLIRRSGPSLSEKERLMFESLDLVYRSACAALFNYVPLSGHPGGSISTGRLLAALLFDGADYDLSNPARDDADVISFAAGHKALGLYTMWALRDEVARLARPELLPDEAALRLRFEDLLGFRRNPTQETELFREFGSKALDGHPTPATPFVKLATGASGVGLASSFGYALAARDHFGHHAPVVHVIEGEGGLTPGRAAEALAMAGTTRLDNLVLHVDWNQASIDSERVCRIETVPGDYVQWNPIELALLHDWNVIFVPDGFDPRQIVAAQRHAAELDTGQPTAIVYATIKGWRYGIEGRASHGAGHKLCSDGFFDAMAPLLRKYEEELPTCADFNAKRCDGPCGHEVIEQCLWHALLAVRRILEKETELCDLLAGRLENAKERLDTRHRAPRHGAPSIDRLYEVVAERDELPESLTLTPGSATTLRDALGKTLGHLNGASHGAIVAGAADLLGSTSTSRIAEGFPAGFLDVHAHPDARLVSVGGICEDAMSGVMSGLATFGRHVGVAASYAAFLAPLGHIAARLHAIGQSAAKETFGTDRHPFFLVCAHAGVKTGEDGPTHADPQALQLLQGNFPEGSLVTLTPWDPQEVAPLVFEALAARPSVIAPFVTRPSETVPDRKALRLAPACAARDGLYRLVTARGDGEGTVVLQGSEVALAFVEEALPLIEGEGIDLNVYYVASEELFDRLPPERRREIFPRRHAEEAIGITGFTLPTMYRWIVSDEGRAATLHPFRDKGFLGSGSAARVLGEAGLDGASQFRAIKAHLDARVRTG